MRDRASTEEKWQSRRVRGWGELERAYIGPKDNKLKARLRAGNRPLLGIHRGPVDVPRHSRDLRASADAEVGKGHITKDAFVHEGGAQFEGTLGGG